MGARTTEGFTIIETILFVGISGGLILMMMLGAGASINAQRYKDATETFKSLVQQQYADLSSVTNTRDATKACNATATIVEGTERRGQSECLLAGKYMHINSSTITIRDVVVRGTPNALITNDLESLRTSYQVNISPLESETRQMEWQTKIGHPKSGTGALSPSSPRKVGILFIRSPDSGRIYTLTTGNVPDSAASVSVASIKSMLEASRLTAERGAQVICVVSDGLVNTGDTALYIAPYATNTGAIEARTNTVMNTEWNKVFPTRSAPQC